MRWKCACMLVHRRIQGKGGQVHHTPVIDLCGAPKKLYCSPWKFFLPCPTPKSRNVRPMTGFDNQLIGFPLKLTLLRPDDAPSLGIYTPHPPLDRKSWIRPWSSRVNLWAQLTSVIFSSRWCWEFNYALKWMYFSLLFPASDVTPTCKPPGCGATKTAPDMQALPLAYPGRGWGQKRRLPPPPHSPLPPPLPPDFSSKPYVFHNFWPRCPPPPAFRLDSTRPDALTCKVAAPDEHTRSEH